MAVRRRPAGKASKSQITNVLWAKLKTLLRPPIPLHHNPLSTINNTMAVEEVTVTVPLSVEAKAAKKALKKAAKVLRRATEAQTLAAAAATAGAEPANEVAEVPAAATGDKRKATEDAVIADIDAAAPSKKNKKTKKDKTAAVAVTPAAGASSAEVEAFLAANNISHEPETGATQFPPVLAFAALPIEEGLRKGLGGYTTPTPIQSASFPVTFGGRDVVGIAETG